jgi:cyclic pyranopterin phosphate synthase
MLDKFDRPIDYLRISVTDRCNLRCKYCMPAEGVESVGHENILTFEEIRRVAAAAAASGFRKFRITGGEPLARLGVVGLVAMIAAVEGVEDLAMTSNGTLLEGMAKPLKDAGLMRVNVSLDTLRADRFADVTRGGSLQAALRGVKAAEQAGLAPIKLNVVAIKGFNDDEICDFARLTKDEGYDVRFIELMPVGGVAGRLEFMPVREIKQRLRGLLPEGARAEAPAGGAGGGGSAEVAEYFRIPGARGRLGFISPISSRFCPQCNKLRLTPDGKLKTCLHSDNEIDVKGPLGHEGDGPIREALAEAVRRKEERHFINEGAEPVKRAMSRIGG